jgi:amidase
MRLVEAAERIRTGELSALELLETTLSRIARLNPEVRAFATQTPELARREAARVDERIASGERALPLAGVPVAVKDLLATRDAPTHAGTVVRKNWNPGVDATVVTRLREAGAVLVGKLTTTEGASGVHHPSVTPPINPWNADYWTGASSSGSGAATAAGLCFAALGSDTGGSIRFPSACCGLVGLKPTWGRVSRFGVFPLAESLDHVGPMARGVADAAAIFEAISGHDPRDPTTLHGAPARLEADTSGVRGLRVGYDEAYCRDGIAPLVADAISKSVDVLREAGAEICRLRVPERPEMISGWLVLCAMEAVAAHDGFYPERGEDYGPALAALLDYGRRRSHAEIARAMIDRGVFRRCRSRHRSEHGRHHTDARGRTNPDARGRNATAHPLHGAGKPRGPSDPLPSCGPRSGRRALRLPARRKSVRRSGAVARGPSGRGSVGLPRSVGPRRKLGLTGRARA